jgi:hypothetical protein
MVWLDRQMGSSSSGIFFEAQHKKDIKVRKIGGIDH